MKQLLLLFFATFVFAACDSGGDLVDPDSNTSAKPEKLDIRIYGKVTTSTNEEPVEETSVVASRTSGEELGQAISEQDGSYEITFQILENDIPSVVELAAEADGFVESTASPQFQEVIQQHFSLSPEEIEISSLDDLLKIGHDPNYPLHGRYVLTQNIDASSTANLNGGKGFDPIGYWAGSGNDDNTPFTGSIDGNGYTITGLHIARSGEDAVGLFAYVDGPRFGLENLTLTDVNVAGRTRVGGVAGRHITPLGVVNTIRNVHVEGTITGEDYVGGLVGEGKTWATVYRSSFTGRVSGTDRVGGLVGYHGGRSIVSSRAEADVVGSIYVGGLVGWQSTVSRVDASFSVGTVFGKSYVGGLIGQNDGEIFRSYALTNVDGDYAVGGLVGTDRAGRVEEAYATGRVTGGQQDVSGGLFGMLDRVDTLVESAFWDVEMSEQAEGVGEGDTDGMIGLTTDEMQGKSAREHMVGFDFEETWRVVTDPAGYPTLFWEQ